MSKHTTLEQLKLAQLRTKAELQKVDVKATDAIKSISVTGNTVKFFTDKTPATGAAAAFTFDFPAEAFLDQAKTTFVDSFVWSEAAYPGSTNPNMEGEPVFVLAVKGETAADSVSYSFVNMAALVDTYQPKTEGKDGSTTITIAGREIDVSVNIFEGEVPADNLLKKKPDGKLYVAHDSTKMDKPTSAAQGNVATFDENKNPVDSGKKIGGATLATGDAADTTGSILATEAAVKAAAAAATGDKADKVSGATDGNLAGLDANGNLTDSGIAAASVITSVTKGTVDGTISVNGGADVALLEVASDAEVEQMLNDVWGASANS